MGGPRVAGFDICHYFEYPPIGLCPHLMVLFEEMEERQETKNQTPAYCSKGTFGKRKSDSPNWNAFKQRQIISQIKNIFVISSG